MEQAKILATAATGNVGTPLVKALHAKQIPFIAATRNAQKATEKFGFEAEKVNLDFRDPSGFSNALKGKKMLFLCGPSATPGVENLLH